MNTVHGHPGHPPHVTPTPSKPQVFYYAAPGAGTVELAGDFNEWHPMPMVRSVDGWWLVVVVLARGDYRYVFLVDGNSVLDPHAGVIRDEQGGQASLLAVN